MDEPKRRADEPIPFNGAEDWVMVPGMRALVSVLVLSASASILTAPRLASAQDEGSDSAEATAPAGEGEAAPEKAEKPKAHPAAKPKPEDAKSPDDSNYGHFMQFGLRGGIVGGIRMVFRYDTSPRCKNPADDPGEPMKFCGFKEPLAADLGLSFAALDILEPFIWGRFGFSGAAETNTNPVVILGVGTRLYTMSDSMLKVFIEPAIGNSLEGWAGNPAYKADVNGFTPEYKKDLIVHLGVGLQVDVAPAVGFYANAGLTTGFLESLSSLLELNGGVQVRTPKIL